MGGGGRLKIRAPLSRRVPTDARHSRDRATRFATTRRRKYGMTTRDVTVMAVARPLHLRNSQLRRTLLVSWTRCFRARLRRAASIRVEFATAVGRPRINERGDVNYVAIVGRNVAR